MATLYTFQCHSKPDIITVHRDNRCLRVTGYQAVTTGC